MHHLILLVRQLRRIAAFQVSTRTMVLVLMLLGLWVATYDLKIPPTVDVSDKLIHAVVFFGFTLLMDLATARNPFWLWKGLPVFMYGLLVEVLQYLTPYRSFSLLDLLADFSGIYAYFLLKNLILYIDRYRRSDN